MLKLSAYIEDLPLLEVRVEGRTVRCSVAIIMSCYHAAMALTFNLCLTLVALGLVIAGVLPQWLQLHDSQSQEKTWAQKWPHLVIHWWFKCS